MLEKSIYYDLSQDTQDILDQICEIYSMKWEWDNPGCKNFESPSIRDVSQYLMSKLIFSLSNDKKIRKYDINEFNMFLTEILNEAWEIYDRNEQDFINLENKIQDISSLINEINGRLK